MQRGKVEVMARKREHKRLRKEMGATGPSVNEAFWTVMELGKLKPSAGKRVKLQCDFVGSTQPEVFRSEEPLHVFDGGTKRSARALAYAQIPPVALRKLSGRFGKGEVTYGRDNWKRSLETRDTARAFVDDVYNHMVEHVLCMNDPRAEVDDHIGGALWGLSVLAYVEEKFGCKWTEL